MKYLVIGTGGTGGAIGGFLAHKGYDVTFIARGAHLEAMKKDGLRIKSGLKGDICLTDIKACKASEYAEKADVIFVCVKSYSLDEIIPLIIRSSKKDTLVIPILNGIGIGDKLYEKYKDAYILDGCVYIVAYSGKPGEIIQSGKVFKVVFGERPGQEVPRQRLVEVKEQLISSGINCEVSDNIVRDTFLKFSFISPYASCGAYYNITAGEMQKVPEYRQMFINLIKEIQHLAEALGIFFENNIVEANLKLLDSLNTDTTASMQKDIAAGKSSETEGLIFDVLRLAEAKGVPVANYKIIAEGFSYGAENK
jgi:2-dehydropantoate 2-reductase